MKRRLATGLMALLMGGCALFDRPDPSVLLGTVEDYPSGAPLPGARIRIAGTDRVLTADAQGRFKLEDLTATVSLQFSAPQHPMKSRLFNLVPGETRVIDVPLPQEGAQVPLNLVLFERGGRIWSADALGSDERCLTADVAGTQLSPTWIAGKSQFAFILRQPGRNEVWIRYPDGRPARYVAEVPDSTATLRWHPLGDQFAYVASTFSPVRGMVTKIRSLDLNNGTQGDLLTGSLEADPAWSADGTQLAWSRRSGQHPWQIWLAGSRGERAHPFNGRGSCVEPAWSPSGQQIAYASNATGRWEIYLAGLGTGISEPLTKTPEGGFCRHPAWSEDGSEILYESNYHPGLNRLQSGSGLYAIRLSDDRVRTVVTDARAGAW